MDIIKEKKDPGKLSWTKGTKKILIIYGHTTKFLQPVAECLGKMDGYSVKVWHGKGVQDSQEMFELMKLADVTFFEWCEDMFMHASHLPKVCPIVGRLHSREMWLPPVAQTNWNFIDHLILVGDHMEKIMRERLGDFPTKVHIIPNGIELDKWTFRERGIPGAEKHIAVVARLSHNKCPHLILQAFKRIYDLTGKNAHLRVAGDHVDPIIQLYWDKTVELMGLKDVVELSGWIATQKEMNEWYQKSDYILSCSQHEAQGMGIMEAMACGLKPLIHHFPDAEQLFPEEYLWTTIDDMIAKILTEPIESQKYRDWIEAGFDFPTTQKKIEKLFKEIANENSGTDIQK